MVSEKLYLLRLWRLRRGGWHGFLRLRCSLMEDVPVIHRQSRSCYSTSDLCLGYLVFQWVWEYTHFELMVLELGYMITRDKCNALLPIVLVKYTHMFRIIDAPVFQISFDRKNNISNSILYANIEFVWSREYLWNLWRGFTRVQRLI